MAQQPNSMNPAWCAARVAEIRDHVNRPGACAPRDTYRAWLIELLSQLDNAADARLASWELEQQVWIAGALSLKRELAEATALATKAESRAAELERAFMPLPFPANTPPETQEWHFCQCGDDVTFLFWGYPDDQYGDTDFDAEPTWCEFVYCFEPTEHIVSAFWLQPKVFDPSLAAPAPLPSSPAAAGPEFVEPACWCHSCTALLPLSVRRRLPPRMVTCPECHNKRCPKADNHIFACTGSNEPGQIGSPAAADRNPADAMGRYETDGAPVWPEDDYIESGDVYLRRHEAEAIQEEEPAATGPGEPDWFSPLVFDSAAEYDASVTDVCRRIESGEVKPIEQAGGNNWPHVKLSAIIVEAETPGVFIGFLKEIGGVNMQGDCLLDVLASMRSTARHFILTYKLAELRAEAAKQLPEGTDLEGYLPFEVYYSKEDSLAYSSKMQALKARGCPATTTGEGKEAQNGG